MSISALTSEAARLLQVFQTKEDEIDAAVASAIAAFPTLVRSYYIDTVSGSNSNAGTSLAPFQSLAKALSLIHNQGGMLIHLWLKVGQSFTVTADCDVANSTVNFLAWGTGDKPIVTFAHKVTQQSNDCYAFTLYNSALRFTGVEVHTDVIPPEHSGLPLWSQCGIAQNIGGRCSFVTCTVELNGLPLVQMRGDLNILQMVSTTIVRGTGTGVLAVLDNTGVLVAEFSSLIVPVGEDLESLIPNRIYSTSGYPLNLLSNYDFAGA